MDVLSFQSRVAWGYVGNAVAVPMIQHFGLNAWPIDTVVLSHHPGHPPQRIVSVLTRYQNFIGKRIVVAEQGW